MGFIALKNFVDSFFRSWFNPAEGKPQNGMVESLDLRMVMPGQILKLFFGLSSTSNENVDDIAEPHLMLEVLSAADENNPACFRVLEFRRLGYDNLYTSEFCAQNKLQNPPPLIWLLESGQQGIQGMKRVFTKLVGGQNFLWTGNDLLCQFKTEDGQAVCTIASFLRHIHISPVSSLVN